MPATLTIAVRRVTAVLWRSQLFRWAVTEWILRVPGSVANWLAVNTPFLAVLRHLHLQRGEVAEAAEVTRLMRRLGELEG